MSVRVAELTDADRAAAKDVLVRALVDDVPHIAAVADEKLFGDSPPPAPTKLVGAWLGGDLVGVFAVCGRWLRVGGVVPEARGKKIGEALLDEAIEVARRAGETRLRIAAQPGNYLAPGLDLRHRATWKWFERRYFARVGVAEDLIVPLEGNQLVVPARVASAVASAAGHGFAVRKATAADAGTLDAFVRQSFSPAWAFEAARALEAPPGGVFIALAGDVVVGFAAHDGNNRGLGWFGPAGTLDSHRGKGIGQALLLCCLEELAAAGHRDCVISWVGPRNFYERTAGAGAGNQYLILERPI